MELIVRNMERQRVVEATERLLAASGKRVLNSEPDHKLREFREEILGRAALLIQDMGHELERLVRRMLGQLEQFKEAHLMVGLDGLRFQETKWLTDGQLQIAFTVGVPVAPDPETFHAVVDPFVDEITEGLDVPGDVRAELAGFVRGLLQQFAGIRKHMSLDLRQIRFDDFAWVTPRVLRMKILLGGKVLLPRDIGWD